MIDYVNISDFKLGLELTISINGLSNQDVLDVNIKARTLECYKIIDINSWADMGPIILQYGICLTSPTVGTKSKQWSASWNEDGGRWSSGDIVAGHENPLRAAAIVFLKMMESKK
jgi:hypothetical protein